MGTAMTIPGIITTITTSTGVATITNTATDAMPVDQSRTSSPRRRGPRIPHHERAEGCMDARLRGHDAMGETSGPPKVSDPEGLTPALSRLMIWLSPAYPVGAF